MALSAAFPFCANAQSSSDEATTAMGMTMDGMRAARGPYAMSREGSGTSWQPDATPMPMLATEADGWSLMAHGFGNAIVDRQSGPRGDDKAFTETMLMLMADRAVGVGTLGLRAMLSLDPTMGKRGYPLLFQTGETADGRTPLVDRQHPHDALMELSASYAADLGDDRAAFVYAGLPGEPALGPPTYMHRFSGTRNPEAPLTHHWFDSTHITEGVATLGASDGPWKLEGSWFNGREPDQDRWNIETRRFDSWSTRLSWNPTAAWAFQLSYGDLRSPEQLEPQTRIHRLTASAIWLTTIAGGDFGATAGWARNEDRGPTGRTRLPAAFAEATWERGDHAVFGRVEQVDKDELFGDGEPLQGRSFVLRKLSIGYGYDFARSGPVRWGVGAIVGVLDPPRALVPVYGRRPLSTLVFLQGRVAP